MDKYPLSRNKIEHILSKFAISRPTIVSARQAGPDEYVYSLRDKLGNSFILWSRDYMSSTDSERAYVEQMLGVNVVKWFSVVDAERFDDSEDKVRYYTDGFWYMLGLCG